MRTAIHCDLTLKAPEKALSCCWIQDRSFGGPPRLRRQSGPGRSKLRHFLGPVEFPIGNVGRDPGTLVFKGKFETESLIVGEVEFSPLVGEQTFEDRHVQGGSRGEDRREQRKVSNRIGSSARRLPDYRAGREPSAQHQKRREERVPTPPRPRGYAPSIGLICLRLRRAVDQALAWRDIRC